MSKQTTTTEEPLDEDDIMSIRDLTVEFRMERGASRVVDNTSMDIKRNEIIGIVGESGSGKSMFADALIDAVAKPGVTQGDITFYPENDDPIEVLDLDKKSLKKFRWEKVSMVFQGAMSSFNPTMTVENHFEETLEAHDFNVKEGIEYARELLEDLYLSPNRVLSSYPHELSGGMKQRVLIALSLILDPSVIVMDEPTAALDLLMQRSIISLIREVKEKHDLTIIFITHDLPLIVALADRLAVLYAFEFVEKGTKREVLENPSHPYTRALLKSTPNLNSPLDQMKPIEGSAPDPVNVPAGCSYHPRCPLSDVTCQQTDPDHYDVSDTHTAACHYWEQASESIELDFTATEDVIQKEYEERADEEPVLSVNDVAVHFSESGGLFSDPAVVQAVDGVNLDVYENDVIVIVGESGCGKTTLGKSTIGLQRPTRGTISYRDQDIWEAWDDERLFSFGGTNTTIPFDEIRQELQIIHQDPGSALNSHKRVITSLEEPLKAADSSLSSRDRRARIMGMIKHVGLEPPEDYANRYPHQLSGGEKQRIALIRAMLMNPSFILADEPVSALDVSLRIEMMDLMLELQSLVNTSYLFISHDLSNARYIAEKSDGRIAVMYLGEIVEIGRPDEIIQNPQHPYTKALLWATPELTYDEAVVETTDEAPLQSIDVPDPTNPPSGCRFHTRCPEAREVCAEQKPLLDMDGADRDTACFRTLEDHEYWESENLTD